MTRMRTFLALLFVFSAQPAAACHIFARWHYPWPQRCAPKRHEALCVRHEALHVYVPADELPPPRAAALQPVSVPADEPLPLPALSLADVIGVEADEATRGRLMLHAILGPGAGR